MRCSTFLLVFLALLFVLASVASAAPGDDKPLTARANAFFSGLFNAAIPCETWALDNFATTATWHHPKLPSGINGTQEITDWCTDTRAGYLPNASYLPISQLPRWTHSGLAYASIPYVWTAVDATDTSELITNWGSVTLAVDPNTTLITFGVETWTFHEWRD